MASFITDVLTRFPSRRLGHWEGRTDSQFCLCVCRTEAQGRRPGPGHPLPAAPRPAGARPRARPLSSCPAGAHSSWPQLPPSPQGAADVRWEAVDARRCGGRLLAQLQAGCGLLPPATRLPSEDPSDSAPAPGTQVRVCGARQTDVPGRGAARARGQSPIVGCHHLSCCPQQAQPCGNVVAR